MSHSGHKPRISHKILKLFEDNYLLLSNRKSKLVYELLLPVKSKVNMIGLSGRSVKEQLVDKLLLLYLLDKHKISGLVKLQKTVFFAEDSMVSQKIKGFNYFFFRHLLGEFSRELESDIENLKESNLVINTETTDEAKGILQRFNGILIKNSEILRRIDAIANFTSSKPLDVVKTMAYTRVIKDGKQVKDISEGTALLFKLEEADAKTKFVIDEGWLGTLEILLNPRIKESLDTAISETEYIPLEV